MLMLDVDAFFWFRFLSVEPVLKRTRWSGNCRHYHQKGLLIRYLYVERMNLMIISNAAHVALPNKISITSEQFLKERDEVLRHKWLESQKAGHNIGFEAALLDWVTKHRQKWVAEQQAL